MKKYLSFLCTLFVMMSFASCGDSSSSDTPEVSESSVSETEEIKVEPLTKKDDFITVPDLYGMDYEKALEKYKDSFAVLISGREESELKAGVIVSQDVEAGTTYEDSGNRPRIHVKLSNGKKVEEVKNENTKLTETCKIGEISFKLPNGYEKENNASDENIEAVTYKYDNSDMVNIAKQPGASQFDWDTMDEETKKLAFQTVITSALNTYFDIIGDLEIITINETFAVKQNAVYSGTTIPLTAYAFVHDDNLYMFMFTNMSNIQQEVIDSIQFLKTHKSQDTYDTTTKKITEPITEPPTTKAPETQPPVIETTPVQTTVHFILNLDTSCIHIKPDCSAAQKITPENYSTVDIAENDLGNYNGTYWACGKCCPNSYRQLLPKF